MTSKKYLKTDRSNIWNHFGKTKEDVDKDVAVINNWLKTQEHLPERPNAVMIEHFLTNCKFSIENTKQTIDMYYSIRTIIPEIFQNTNPFSQNMADSNETLICCPLPNLTPELRRIIFVKLTDVPSKKFNASKGIAKAFYHIHEIRIWEDLALADIFVMDFNYFQAGLIPKVSPKDIRNIAFIGEKLWNQKFKEMHLFNVPGIADVIITMLRTYLHKGIKDRIFVHKSLEDLYKSVPKHLLPQEYGGDEDCLHKLTDSWMNTFKVYQSRFDQLDSMVVNEAVRPPPTKNCDILGYYGNYMKLDVN